MHLQKILVIANYNKLYILLLFLSVHPMSRFASINSNFNSDASLGGKDSDIWIIPNLSQVDL